MRSLPAFSFLILCACGCGFTDDAERAGAWLRMSNLAEPAHLDPALISAVEDQRIHLALFENLLAYDPRTLEPVAGVAESWRAGDDGRTWTFRLRACAWSNGDPVTAGAFVWSWHRVLATRPDDEIAAPIAAPYADLLFCIEGARAFHEGRAPFSSVGVTAPSDRELVVRLEHPTPWFLELLCFPTFSAVHRPTVERHGAGWTRVERFVGNGPFVLAHRRPGVSLEVRRNPRYWDAGRVALDGVVYYSTDQIDTALDQFLTGDTDWVRGFNPKKAPAWEADPELAPALHASDYLATSFYRFNVRRPPLDDPRVRRALSLAIDRAALTSSITGLGETPADGLVPHVVARRVAWPDRRGRLPCDPERARALLAEAGFPGGAGFREIAIAFNTDVKNQSLAEAVQQMWRRELGIPVVLENREKRVHLALERAGDFDVSRGSWVGDFNDPVTFLDFMGSARANNRTGWRHEEFDRLLALATTSVSEGERLAALARAEEILVYEEAALLPLYFVRTPYVLRPGAFAGIHENGRDLHPPKWIRPVRNGS